MLGKLHLRILRLDAGAQSAIKLKDVKTTMFKVNNNQDLFSKTDEDGNTFYFIINEFKFHREDGPAIELSDGSKLWFKNGKKHREDGPAVERVDGHKEWYINDKLHREDGPAIERPNGDCDYILNHRLHREDGPAIIRQFHEEYWKDGKFVKINFLENKNYYINDDVTGCKLLLKDIYVYDRYKIYYTNKYDTNNIYGILSGKSIEFIDSLSEFNRTELYVCENCNQKLFRPHNRIYKVLENCKEYMVNQIL